MPVLPLKDMHLTHWGLTEAVAANNCEAAAVCLSRHHRSPTIFKIDDNGSVATADVEWSEPDDRTTGAWNNRTDATEMGACACGIAAVQLARGLFAIRRAETTRGADYYIAPAGGGIDDLEQCYRLEVSGVDAGVEREIRQRVLSKIQQTRRGTSSLPAVAAIVGFAAKLIVLADAGTP